MSIRKIKVRALSLAITMIFSSLANSSPNVGNQPSSHQQQAIEKYFNGLVAEEKIAGATIATLNNKSKQVSSFGYLDKENSIPMPNDALIPLGSMTKIVTAVAIMQLYEQGLLALNDPVDKYIPAFSNLRVASNPEQSAEQQVKTEALNRKITILDLLTHTAGLTYSGLTFSGKVTVSDILYQRAGFLQWRQPLSKFVDAVTQLPLAYQPGADFEYSLAYDVLGCLIEIVSKQRLEHYFKDNIFIPLEMEKTAFYAQKNWPLSNLYTFDNGKLRLDENRLSSRYLSVPPVNSAGGGWSDSYCGLISTADDYYKLLEMLLNYGAHNKKQIISKQSVLLMTTNHVGNLAHADLGDDVGYGIGMGVVDGQATRTEQQSNYVFWSGAPYNNYFWIDFEAHQIGLMLTNTGPYGNQDIIDHFKRFSQKYSNTK
ncbi:serine hydrolase domain-containing protein [Pseudomonas asiatica]|uniref:serine hydrolase domain-containing protein n=1 Tax=Pseudomonas asiatica TaxID=2219225 RepID=UPI00383B3446